MSESVFVTIGGEQVSVIIEGGALAPSMSVAQGELNKAVAAAVEAAGIALGAMVNKADKDLGNATTFNPAAPSIIRSARSKFTDYATAFDVIPPNLHAAITSRTSSTDVSGYLQQALDSFGSVHLNDGLFLLEAGGLTVPGDHSRLIGGKATSELRVVGNGGFDLIKADVVSDFMLDGVTLSCMDGALADGTTAIRFKNSKSLTAQNFRILGTFATQVALEGGSSLPQLQYDYKLDAYSMEATCVEGLTVGKVGEVVQEVYLGSGVIVGGSTSGVGLYNASGVYPGSVSILGGTRALVANPGVGQVVRYVRDGDFICDSTTSEPVLLTTSGGVVETWDTSIWGASSATEAGILIDEASGTIRNLELGVTAINNWKSGVVVTKASGIRLREAQAGLNSRAGSAAFPNINVGANATNTYISGKAANVGSNTFTELASYGVIIESGALGTHLDGLDARGCVTGTVIDNGTNTTITNCPGVTLLSEGSRGVAGRETWQGLNKTAYDFTPNPLPGADNTAALQAMIDYAVAFGAFGVTVKVPQGDWYTDSLTINGRCNIDFGTSRLIKFGTTGDLISIVGTQASPIFGVRITGTGGFAQAIAGATSGHMIYMEWANACFIEASITPFPHSPWQGIGMYRCTSTRLDVEISECLSDGFKAIDCVDITFAAGSRSDGNAGRGFAFDTCSGVYTQGATSFGNTGYDWDFDETVTPVRADAGMSFLFLANTVGDTGGSSTFRLNKVKSSVLTGCWGSSQNVATANLHGIIIDQCSAIDLIGCKALNNNGCGLFITGGSVGVNIIGGEYNDNGVVAGSTNRAGICIGSNCEVRILGTQSKDTRSSGKTQQYGIQCTGTAALLSVGGASDLRGNAVGPMIFAFPPTLFQQDGTNLTGEATAVTSASVIDVGYFNKSISVTGTTDVLDITPKWTGREITLLVDGSFNFVGPGFGGGFLLPGSVSALAVTPNSSLTTKVKPGGQLRTLASVVA